LHIIPNYLRNITVHANTSNFTLVQLESQLTPIIEEINRLLPQLRTFITRFNNFIIDNDINVITDADGNLGVDVSANLSDGLAQQHANRVQVLDSLIHNHYHIIEQLVQRGSTLEDNIRSISPNYLPQIRVLLINLNQLMSSYAHR
jgi:hypothetical protein